jgi:iron(III) transport system substrate-binding protein
VDFLDTPLGYMPLLLNRGLAEAFDWPGALGTDRDKVLYEGRGVIGWDIDMPISFNTGMAKAADVKSWDDLLDPKWRGKLLIEKRGLAFAVLALKWGEEKTSAYLKKLMENRPIVTVGSTQTIEALAGGQGAIAVGPYGGPVLKAKAEGAPIDVAMVGPVPTMLETAVQVKDGPHPNATRLWMHFLTTPKAQELLYKGQGLGFVHGSALSPLGELYKQAGLEIILESTDAQLMQKMLALVSAIVGQH